MSNEQTTIQVVYPITEADITARFAGYAELTADSPQGYKAVQAAIGELRSARVDVEKRRKELKADSLEYGRKVDAVAKYLTEKLEEIENPLKAKKAAVSMWQPYSDEDDDEEDEEDEDEEDEEDEEE